MSRSLKMLCTLCFVLWVLEHMGFDSSAYMAGYMVADTVKEVGAASASMVLAAASSALTEGGAWLATII